MPEPAPEVRERFLANFDRVIGLAGLYREVSNRVAGRPTVREADVLRAAVVLLHATLEDLMRTLALQRLPAGGRDVLAHIPFAKGDGRKTTLTLGDLAAYRGRAVDDVIVESVRSYLDRRSYNDTDDLAGALREMGLSVELDKGLAPRLQSLMKRRHHIAHRLDANESSGRGHHPARSIRLNDISGWIQVVRQFGLSVLDGIEGGASHHAEGSGP